MLHSYIDIELRADTGSLSGLALPYNGSAVIVKDGMLVQERVQAGALQYDGQGVLLTVNHDNTRILARSPDTLVLREEPSGLYFQAEPPVTRDYEDARKMIQSKVLTGVSIEFHVGEDEVRDGVRYVKRGLLSAVSLVAKPAYKQTHIEARRRRRVWRH